MIKLIVSDLDGTLVEDGGGVLNPEYFSTQRSTVKGDLFLRGQRPPCVGDRASVSTGKG